MASIINSTTTAGVTVTGDNSGSLQLATNNGTTAVTIDTSQNVGIGSTSPVSLLEVKDASPVLTINQTDTSTTCRLAFYGYNRNYETTAINTTEGATAGAGNLVFFTNSGGSGNSSERMRITSGGALLVGTTAATPGYGNTNTGVQISSSQSNFSVNTVDWVQTVNQNGSDAGTRYFINFRVSNSSVGNIQSNGSNCTFNSTSDYRLKEDIAPMVGALNRVSQLKPVTYKWKLDGSKGEGFIAHELQKVVPECVSGEKDAVNEDGSIKPQGVDTSFLVATLTAAIQELNAKVEAQAVRIAELEGAK